MRPYLIQRGILKTGHITGIDSFISYDYMGASEFEFGALPKALRELTAKLASLKITDTGLRPLHPLFANRNLKVWLIADQQTTEAALPILQALAKSDQSFHLHERTEFAEALRGGSHIRFWWDIEHTWMALLGNDREAIKLMGALTFSSTKILPINEEIKPFGYTQPLCGKVRVECCGRWTMWYHGTPPKICPKCKQIMV